MSENPGGAFSWGFYAIGTILILLGIAFFIIPLLARTGSLSGIRVPWIILYVYNRDGFYFVTSPILIILSVIVFLILALRR